jgi:hypothetical protein
MSWAGPTRSAPIHPETSPTRRRATNRRRVTVITPANPLACGTTEFATLLHPQR